jgi:hypothetical protein
MHNCPIMKGMGCYPSMKIQNKLETNMFEVEYCYGFCKNEDDTKLKPADLNCQDLNDADWSNINAGWERFFECTWKEF